MKVGITGGSGFLGKELVNLLVKEANITPVIIGRSLLNEQYEYTYRKTDYTKESLDINLQDIDAVVHLAAKRGAAGRMCDFHENEIITENLYESCKGHGIKNIVFASSIAVYSDVSKIPWNEQQIPSPKTFYGISKMACEYIGDIYHKKFGLNIKSLRIAQVLGEGERKGHMMNTFIDNAYEKKILNVIGKSIAKREFVYVKDVARAILLALSKEEIHGSFNIGSNEAYTNLEIAKMVNECFDNQGNMTYDDSIDEGIESSLMDSSKAFKILGYKPMYNMKEALNDIKAHKVRGGQDV